MILRGILRLLALQYKMTYVYKILLVNPPDRDTFVLQLFARIEIGNGWAWNIVWTDELHSYLHVAVIPQNCRVGVFEKYFPQPPLPILFAIMSSISLLQNLSLGHSFLRKCTSFICAITGQRYEYLLRNHIILGLNSISL
ncbi:hypothetical protein AVEN_140663-1 [Araneus ventricosus]|uniref:Uncharacterized protein n=1 Tax=Araneus ventricosus TaxID=182803 RepID=A0A4Y2C789_ARAVE|nr:hypothetical protein AVEN_140663-1 [Araneus ventricosus]